MISLEQIRLLEARVVKAVELINTLKAENNSLRAAIDSAQSRMQDLEKLVGDLKTDQREIERGILRAIENLDQLEDEVVEDEDRPESSGGAPEGPAGRRASPPSRREENAGSDTPVSQDDTEDADNSGTEEQELDIF